MSGEFSWQNQAVLNAELLGARRIGKDDHPIGRQPSNGDDRTVGSYYRNFKLSSGIKWGRKKTYFHTLVFCIFFSEERKKWAITEI